MIGQHCGFPLMCLSETRKQFSRRCQKCGRIFTQRKRQPTAHNRLTRLKKGY